MDSWFDRNLALLAARDGGLASLLAGYAPRRPAGPGPRGPAAGAGAAPGDPGRQVFTAPPGAPGAFGGAALPAGVAAELARGPEGPVLSLLAPAAARLTGRSPRGEDLALAERFLAAAWPAGDAGRAGGGAGGARAGPPGVTALGLGLGWHIERVIQVIGDAPLWIVEAAPQLWAAALAARDMGLILTRPNTVFLCGAHPALPAGAPGAVLARPASLRCFPGCYPAAPPPARAPARPSPGGGRGAGRAGEGGRPGAARPPGRRLRPRVLFFRSGYFLDREIRSALARLDWPCALWEITDYRDAGKDRGADFRRLLGTIKDFRPDLALTVNHLGFDAGGLLAGILARLGIPAASWFVDSPWFILKGAELGPCRDLWALSWDSDYLGPLRELGFANASHLPLAADEGLLEGAGPAGAGHVRDIAFVGDSHEAATGKYLALAGAGPELLPEADALAAEFLETGDLVPDLAAARGPAGRGARAPRPRAPSPALAALLEDPRAALNLAALVTWRASRLARLRVLGAMPEGRLTVAGDPGWRGLLRGGAALPGPVDYYAGLPAFYRGTRVNLNVTSAQMKTGVNQRVFDAPAAGGFLLTDRRRQLDGLFGPGEVCQYSEPGEARELALWHLARPGARARVAAAARRAIAARHTYRHRLREMAGLILGGG